jgi:putative hydrolase of the HAD superfamily
MAMRSDNTPTPFNLILFDLGGVIIELSGVQQMLGWSKNIPSEKDLWHRWLSSRAVRDFESGQSTPDHFAHAMIAEFKLSVTPESFLDAFSQWTRGLYAGAEALLQSLSRHFSLGILSNTNELHWHRFETEMNFLHHFDYTYPSHLTGRLKPDRETFRYVAEASGYLPNQILFFDDNPLNTDSAKSTGIAAYTVSGASGVVQKITELNLIVRG